MTIWYILCIVICIRNYVYNEYDQKVRRRNWEQGSLELERRILEAVLEPILPTPIRSFSYLIDWSVSLSGSPISKVSMRTTPRFMRLVLSRLSDR